MARCHWRPTVPASMVGALRLQESLPNPFTPMSRRTYEAMDLGSRPTFELPDFEEEPLFLVDDEEDVLESLRRFLTRAGFRVHAFASPEDALAEVRRSPPKVIVTDKRMSGMDGLTLAERAHEVDPKIRMILVTGAGNEEAAQSALRLGFADYVTKPVDALELARSVLKAFTDHAHSEFERSSRLWLQNQVRGRTDEIRDLTLGTLATLLNTLEARSPHFKGHSQSVADCAEGIARELGLADDEVETVRTAGLLHDIGMIAVPDRVWDKPGDLTDEEREAIRAHSRRGAEILEPLIHLSSSAQYILEHHERLDGSGYPGALRGDEISLGGQIVGLAETWTAMTEDRSFRDRMSESEALSTLVGAADLWYSSRLLEALRVSALG